MLVSSHAAWVLPQTDGDLQRVFQQCAHEAARQSTDDRQIRDQARQLRTELAGDIRRDRRTRRLPTRRTEDGGTPILGDVGLDRRQFGDLMAPWLATHHATAHRQRVIAVPTDRRPDLHYMIHALGRHNGAIVPHMTGLPAGLRRLRLRRPRSRGRPAMPIR